MYQPEKISFDPKALIPCPTLPHRAVGQVTRPNGRKIWAEVDLNTGPDMYLIRRLTKGAAEYMMEVWKVDTALRAQLSKSKTWATL